MIVAEPVSPYRPSSGSEVRLPPQLPPGRSLVWSGEVRAPGGTEVEIQVTRQPERTTDLLSFLKKEILGIPLWIWLIVGYLLWRR